MAGRSATALAALVALIAAPAAHAQTVPRVAVTVQSREAWTGQRISMQVELRSRASFGGATDFYLPDVPKTLIMKVGNPVVSSAVLDGETWMVQIHEFAVFSQVDGRLVIPEFPVHFGARDDFVGPVNEVKATVPSQEFHIRRPPGSESIGFVVTTESLQIDESWDPEPGPLEIGSLVTRTVSQKAAGLTGMALAPLPTTAPDGVRVYAGQPEVTDDTERGSFVGGRKDTVTYKFQQPGTITLPAIRFAWWNPKAQQLLEKTLPAVEVEARALPAPPEPPPEPETGNRWLWLLPVVVGVVLVLWWRASVAEAVRRARRRFDPPERIARRKLLRACRRNDGAEAERAWLRWSAVVPSAAARPSADLTRAVNDLDRHLYGRAVDDVWNGRALARAVRRSARQAHQRGQRSSSGALPPLNASDPSG